MGKARTISTNIKYSMINQAFEMLVNFLLFPFVVAKVGAEVYGAYLIVTTMLGYLGIMDMGMPGAVVKFVAEFMGKKEQNRVKDIVSAYFTFSVFIGVVAAAALFVLSFVFGKILAVTPGNHNIVRSLFMLSAGSSLMLWPLRVFDGALQGCQRYKAITLINILSTGCMAVVLYLVIARTGNIIYYAGLCYLFTILKYAGYWLFYAKGLKLGLVFPFFRKDVFHTIFSFSLFVFMSSIVNIVVLHLDDIVIGILVSVAMVTFYNVAYTMQRGFRALNSMIAGPLFPFCAEMEGRGEFEGQRQLLFKGTRYMTMIFIPAVIITMIFARHFIFLWMGQGFTGSVWPARVLMFFWLFNGTVEVLSGMLSAKGYVKEVFHIGVANAVCNLLLSVALARPLGILGVALGTAVPMVFVHFPLLLRVAVKALDIRLKDYFERAIKKNLGLYLFVIIISVLGIRVYAPPTLIAVVAQMGTLYAAALLAGYFFFLTRDERREIFEMIRI